MRGKYFEEWEGVNTPIAGNTLIWWITATNHVTSRKIWSFHRGRL